MNDKNKWSLVKIVFLISAWLFSMLLQGAVALGRIITVFGDVLFFMFASLIQIKCFKTSE